MARTALFALLLLFAWSGNGAEDWTRNAVVYQVYPRSFKDSNADGIGDLNGITSKLEHIKDIGADALWMSPIFASPQVDFGYDVSNFTDINPEYGTLAEFDKLVARAKSLGLKVLLDFVPNHSSSEHEWFKKSVKKIKPYDEYYVWRDARIENAVRRPPNNWLCNLGGSAWEWSPVRNQYYLHQFAIGQPDLNYRSEELKREMSSVLNFWLDRGVDGFRIDAVSVIFEDSRYLDEPIVHGTGLPDGDYDTLDHIYTKDQEDVFGLIQSWRRLLDDHPSARNGSVKIMMTEADPPVEQMKKYYLAGSNVPFNFDFILRMNRASTALDFKLAIDRWNNNIPNKTAYVSNWVVGNHDNSRVATRFGPIRADHVNILATMLPGIAVVYNGDEIGMEDRNFTYAETVDPLGCNAGPDRYRLKSRDPERTPFQWNGSISAGFSTSERTWLPVHSNYKSLNLARQRITTDTHYRIFKALTAMKRRPVCRDGSSEVVLVSESILAVVRRSSDDIMSPVVTLLNFAGVPHAFDASAWLDVPQRMVVYTANVASKFMAGLPVDISALELPAYAAVVFRRLF